MNDITGSYENITINGDVGVDVFGKKSPILLTSYYVFSILGIPGNIITVIVLLSSVKLRQKPINLILVHQAVVDCIACMMTLMEEFMEQFGKQYSSKPFICHYIISKVLSGSVMYVSSYNIMLLSIERCYAIMKPLQYDSSRVKKRLPLLFVTNWCFNFLILCIIPATTIILGGHCFVGYKLMTTHWGNFYSLYEIFFGIILPTCVSVVCYWKMFHVLNQSAHLSEGDSQSSSIHKLRLAQMNIVKTCLLVVIVFVMCWSIPETAMFLLSINVYSDLNNTHYHVGRLAVILNSVLNSYIYAIRYDDFKEQLKYLIGRSNKNKIKYRI